MQAVQHLTKQKRHTILLVKEPQCCFGVDEYGLGWLLIDTQLASYCFIRN